MSCKRRHPSAARVLKHKGAQMRISSAGLAALAAASLLAIAGCGGSDGGSDAGAKSNGSPTTNGDGQAKQGGILRVGTSDSIASFNPWLAQTPVSGIATSMVYPSLTQLDYKDGAWVRVPDLATSWDVKPKQLTFKLRPGATWSDGKPLTADDVAWTINIMVKFKDGPAGESAASVDGIIDATAPDPTTLQVNYRDVRANSLERMGAFPILPKHVWEEHAQGNGRGLRTFQPDRGTGGLVGSGPFTLKEYEKNGTTVFIRNDEFYGTHANADAVAMTSYTNADAMVQAYRDGELDYIQTFPASAVPAVKNTPESTLTDTPSFMHAVLLTNANPRKPENRELLDPKVTTALQMCIDRDEIIETVFQGNAKTIETNLGSTSQWENDDLKPRPSDCAAANKILDELGYKRGADGVRVVPATTGEHAQPEHPMSYGIVTPNAGPFNIDRTVTIVRANLKELGVDVSQDVVGDVPATWSRTMGEDCDPVKKTGYTSWDFWVDLDVATPDPFGTLHNSATTSWCAWNLNGFDSPEYDKLYQQAVRELDEDKRGELIDEMQKIFYDSGSEFPLAEMVEFTAHSNTWDGWMPPELSRGYNSGYYAAPYMVK